MDRNLILDLITANVDFKKKEDLEIIECINEARIEIEVARSMFEFVSDPKLVELAIYSEEVAKRRYDYLISLAKERSINKKIQ